MQLFDPNGVFLNDFGRRLLETGAKIDTDPHTVHCALLDNCICGEDADCANGQVWGTLNSFNVCQSAPGTTLLSGAVRSTPAPPQPSPLPFDSMLAWMQSVTEILRGNLNVLID